MADNRKRAPRGGKQAVAPVGRDVGHLQTAGAHVGDHPAGPGDGFGHLGLPGGQPRQRGDRRHANKGTGAGVRSNNPDETYPAPALVVQSVGRSDH